MHLTSFLENGRLTIALEGEIDHHRARSYIESIAAKIDAYSPEECILDFSAVSFVDSSGIAVVINSMRRMAQIEGELFLAGLGEQPKRVFHTSGIDRLVHTKEVCR
ncbi:MAG: STAS domain-containing protein [Oscillospiraceae bacterium]|nr:STAS domain-containing protein [Oscillospiraceae bacterium]